MVGIAGGGVAGHLGRNPGGENLLPNVIAIDARFAPLRFPFMIVFYFTPLQCVLCT